MSQATDLLNMTLTNNHVVFRTPDGVLLGSGPMDDVAAPIAHAILGFPESAASFELRLANGSVLRLAADSDDRRVPLVWTTGTGTLLATVNVPRPQAEAAAEWLLENLSRTPLSEWLAVRERLLGEITSARDAEFDARQRYIDALPTVPIARDPFTGDVVVIPFELGGLDGPFWDANNPMRPAPPMPPSYIVTTGSMRIAHGNIEQFGHLALPGPAVPFVVPDLLARDSVKAVLVTIPVGPHLGQAVSYFTERPPAAEPLPDEWGRREHWLRDATGRPITMASAGDSAPPPDFNLRPWIDAGKLGWVAPGDNALRLRWSAAQCLYLTIRGNHEPQRAQAGEVS